jgi:hypothetical protein
MTPSRIQLSRKKGFRLPPGARAVSRPSRWGNPFKVVQHPAGWWTVIDTDDRSQSLKETPVSTPDKWGATVIAVRLFELHTNSPSPELPGLYPDYPDPAELAGLTLACWCPVLEPHIGRWPCHADILLARANPD